MKKQTAKKVLSLCMAAALAVGTASTAYGVSVTGDASSKEYNSTADGENAVLVDGKTVKLTDVTVNKTGDAAGEEADFSGSNAAVLVKNGGVLTLSGATVETDGTHANGVFSTGSGTSVTLSDSTITTKGNASGGIMTTGGGATTAKNLTVDTAGNSSAAIRSDRGGGTVNVTGGTYTTSGVGSPAIYSTAKIAVKDAALTANTSEAVVIEGANSVNLTDCTVIGNNTKTNGQATNLQNVMLYQSMSGDASQGTASFAMTGGAMTAKSGDLFYVTNTNAVISLADAALSQTSGELLKVQAGPWGTAGSNGGNVTFNAADQTLQGDITVDSSSTLNLLLTKDSDYTGAVNTSGQAGKVYVSVPAGCTWTLTGDSFVTGLTCDASAINLNGYTLDVNGTAYTAGTASTGTAVSGSTTGGTGTQQPGRNGQRPNGQANGQTDRQPPQNSQNGQNTDPENTDTQNTDTQNTDTQNTDTQQPGKSDQSNGRPFRDVADGSWYAKAVDFCHDRGIASGTDSDTFSPQNTLSRAEMAQFLYKTSGTAETDENSSFTDVDDSAWYANAVAWAAQSSVVTGRSQHEFAPASDITRQDLVCMLYRYYTAFIKTGLDKTADLSAYTDADSVASYAKTAMEWAVGNGIVTGIDNQLDPTGSATRAQAVQMLYQMLSALEAE